MELGHRPGDGTLRVSAEDMMWHTLPPSARTRASSAWSAGVTSRQDSLLDTSSRLSTMLNSFMTTKIEPYMPAAPRMWLNAPACHDHSKTC